VPEIQLDPVTGLSGSGPSYVREIYKITIQTINFLKAFSIIEGLADGGVKLVGPIRGRGFAF
jgi:hypothetical protein